MADVVDFRAPAQRRLSPQFFESVNIKRASAYVLWSLMAVLPPQEELEYWRRINTAKAKKIAACENSLKEYEFKSARLREELRKEMELREREGLQLLLKEYKDVCKQAANEASDEIEAARAVVRAPSGGGLH